MSAKILVIEDNQPNSELMLYLLSSFGFIPLSASDGEAGLEIALRQTPNLIICEIQLPKMNGYDVVKELKRHHILKYIPVLAVTAYPTICDRESLLASGFDGYISKPINPESFVEEVENCIDPKHKFNPQTHRHESGGNSEEDILENNTIIVVDESVVNLEIISSTLEPSGYDLILARSASEAFATLLRTIPDLILSDLHMHSIEGYDFLRALKQDPALKEIPLLIISSVSIGEVDRDMCMELGAKGFIVQPINPKSLLQEVEACLHCRNIPI